MMILVTKKDPSSLCQVSTMASRYTKLGLQLRPVDASSDLRLAHAWRVEDDDTLLVIA